jgi:UDP-N-acetyl-D-galactosamine dehydrogenase
VILSGRRINDGMGKFIGEQTVKTMIKTRGSLNGAVVNVLGLTFKENCPDLRNSKVVDIIRELKEYGLKVHVHDPHGDNAEAEHEYGITLTAWDQLPKADALVVAVSHREYLAMPIEQLTGSLVADGCVIDVKSVLPREALAQKGHPVWRL